MAVQLRLSITEALYQVCEDNKGNGYDYKEGRWCAPLVREYLQHVTGEVAEEHKGEGMTEMTAMKFAIKSGGLMVIYQEWLDSLPMVFKDEPSNMEIGDIALVGGPECPPLISNFGTEYKCGKHRVLMGIVEGGGNLLHWTDKGLGILVSDWIPWTRVVYRPIIKKEK